MKYIKSLKYFFEINSIMQIISRIRIFEKKEN